MRTKYWMYFAAIVPATAAAMTEATEMEKAYGKLPMRFERNQGQTAPEVRYVARGRAHTLFLTGSGAVLQIGNQAVGMGLDGAAHPVPQPAGEDKLPGLSNYLTGRDESQWTTAVESFRRVRYGNVYRGVDLVYYGNEGALEYDFVLQPGADASTIALRFDGAAAQIDAGELRLMAGSGELARFRKPFAYQEVDGSRKAVGVRYTLSADGRAGFALDAYDRTKTLVIDPVLSYSTYLGGSGYDQITGITLDASGNAYLTGLTASTTFPVTTSAVNRGGFDCFVTKLNPAGSAMIFSTFIGGSGTDGCNAIKVDGSGNVVVAGHTGSADFPLKLAVQNQLGGGGFDAFVTKLGSNGSTVQFSTYLGGAGTDIAYGVGLLADGSVAVAGFAEGAFPVTANAFQSTNVSGAAFVARLRIGTLFPPVPSSKVFATLFGGGKLDMASALAVEAANDHIWIAGSTASPDLPLSNAVQSTFGGVDQSGLGDGLVARFSPAGALTFSTYIGGSAGDSADAITVDASGAAYIAGFTQSANFPFRGALTPSSGYDGFVAKMIPGQVKYSRLLGGAPGRGIAVNSAGEAYVAGFTSTSVFTPLAPVANGAASKAFVARLNAAGSQLIYGVSLAGADLNSAAFAIAVDAAGNAVAGGSSNSATFPLQGPLQSSLSGDHDAVVFKISGQ